MRKFNLLRTYKNSFKIELWEEIGIIDFFSNEEFKQEDANVR